MENEGETVLRLLSMVRREMTIAEAAKEMGVPYSVVRQLDKKHRLGFLRHGEIMGRRVERLVERGMTASQIAAELNRTVGRVMGICRERGLAPSPGERAWFAPLSAEREEDLRVRFFVKRESVGHICEAMRIGIQRLRSEVARLSGKPYEEAVVNRKGVEVGGRYGSVVVTSVKSAGRVAYRCDCGVEGEKFVSEMLSARYKCGPSCPIPRPTLKNLTGARFGKWEVLAYAGSMRWHCRCDCGTVTTVDGKNLTSGRSKGCRECHRAYSRIRYRRGLPPGRRPDGSPCRDLG